MAIDGAGGVEAAGRGRARGAAAAGARPVPAPPAALPGAHQGGHQVGAEGSGPGGGRPAARPASGTQPRRRVLCGDLGAKGEMPRVRRPPKPCSSRRAQRRRLCASGSGGSLPGSRTKGMHRPRASGPLPWRSPPEGAWVRPTSPWRPQPDGSLAPALVPRSGAFGCVSRAAPLAWAGGSCLLALS